MSPTLVVKIVNCLCTYISQQKQPSNTDTILARFSCATGTNMITPSCKQSYLTKEHSPTPNNLYLPLHNSMFCMYNYFVTFVNTISIAQMHWNDYTLCINYHLCKDFSHAKHYSIRVKVIMSKLHAHCFLVYSQRRNKRGLVTTKRAILILPNVLHMEVSERSSILLQYSCMILKLKYWIE